MAKHRDNHLGSMAIHYAAKTGNRYLIEKLMLDFTADPIDKTSDKKTVIHCAA